MAIEPKNRKMLESKDCFSSSSEGSRAGMWEWQDLSKNDAYWSPQFYQLLGYQNSEISPRMRTFLKWLHPEDRKKALLQIRKLIKDRVTFESDIRIRTKSGDYRWFKGTSISPDTRSGHILQLAGSIQEIYEKQIDPVDLVDPVDIKAELNSANAEYLTLVETAVDAIITIDNFGTIERFNPAAEVLFGYERKEVIGQNVKILMAADQASKHDEFLSTYLRTGVKNIIGIGREVVGRRKGGVKFPLELSIGQMSGEKGGYVGILRDITDRKKIEYQISDHVKKLARSNEDLAQFAYVASHDLKAPLRGIEQLAGWIEEKVEPHMDEECASYMKLLRGRINRLDKHLSGLLEYSRIGRIDTTIESVNLNVLTQGVIDLLDTENFSISVEKLPTIQAPSTEMTILFQNLIENAVKHHDQNKGNVQITSNEDSEYYEIAIHDDGPGIPENMAEKVFFLFQTLKPRDEVEGSGMGLAFVKKIVERNNASISIEKSKFDRGTAFVIHWPKQP